MYRQSDIKVRNGPSMLCWEARTQTTHTYKHLSTHTRKYAITTHKRPDLHITTQQWRDGRELAARKLHVASRIIWGTGVNPKLI